MQEEPSPEAIESFLEITATADRARAIAFLKVRVVSPLWLCSMLTHPYQNTGNNLQSALEKHWDGDEVPVRYPPQ